MLQAAQNGIINTRGLYNHTIITRASSLRGHLLPGIYCSGMSVKQIYSNESVGVYWWSVMKGAIDLRKRFSEVRLSFSNVSHPRIIKQW